MRNNDKKLKRKAENKDESLQSFNEWMRSVDRTSSYRANESKKREDDQVETAERQPDWLEKF